MLNLETVLVVVSPNPYSPAETKYLAIEKNGLLHLPTQIVECGEVCRLVVDDLFEKILGFAASWVQLKQGMLSDNPQRLGCEESLERYVAVPYGCMVPYECAASPPNIGRWVTFSELAEYDFYSDHKDILMKMAGAL